MGTMRIGSTGIVVDDQDQAEQFYSRVLGFQVKTRAPYGPNERWLSMVAPEEPDGVRLVHLTDEPARAFQVAATAAAAAAVADASRNVFRREGEYWTISYEGAVVHLKDAKGLRHLARLLTHPGREFHAVDLEAAEGQAGPVAPVGPEGRTAGGGEGLVVRPDLGDAGVLLDATAKAAYQARIQELRGEVEEAEGFNDPARATKARQELGFLVAELARAVGLGGRDRRAASHAERTRLNVTRTIRAAMANLARANPARIEIAGVLVSVRGW
jgi:non-specific serine/threonine protein kinase